MKTTDHLFQNPWTTLESKVIYTNPWIRVREDKVIRPDGKEGIYGVVETRIATAVVALTSKNEIVLIGQYRYPTKHYSWEVVEGGSEDSESALETAKRELKEEAGMEASEWVQLGEEFHLSNCHSSEIAVVFLARNLSEGSPSPEGTEILQQKKVPFEEVVELVQNGEIKDALSIIAILRAKEFLRK